MIRHVVCVQSDGVWKNLDGGAPFPNPPQKGVVYTVIRSRTRPDGRTMLKFAEIGRGYFNARYFRPLKPLRVEDFTRHTERL